MQYKAIIRTLSIALIAILGLSTGDLLRAESAAHIDAPTSSETVQDRALAFYRSGNLPAARVAYQQACNQGTAMACEVAGMMALRGQGGQADAGAATAAFTQSCTIGSENGCVLLSGLFIDGSGSPDAARSARITLTNACGDGTTSACTQLAIFMGGGIGGPTNRYSGRSLLEKSCSRNDALACEILSERQNADD